MKDFSMKLLSNVVKLFSLFILVAIPFSSTHAAVVINEIMASNAATIQDPYGDYSDWIELRNTGSASVNIANYNIFDDSFFWPIPAGTTIPGNGYLILWANDKNNPSTFSTNFKLSAGGETVTLRNASGAIVDQIAYPSAATDESYGRYPDGTGSFQRMNSPTPGNTNVSSSLPLNPNAHLIKINEVVISNTNGLVDEDGTFQDWFELYNTGTMSINMNGLRVADSSKQWVFPSVNIPAHGYLVIYASDKNRTSPNLHTNFQLTSTGEVLTFMNTDGSVLDQINIPAIPPNSAYARVPDGNGAFAEVANPSPGSANPTQTVQPNPNALFITINEISSNNVSGLRDFENEFQDWIELYNKGSVTVDMQDLRLADSERVWAFPAGVSISPGQYRVIFASGKNLTTPELHTNFSISSATGEVISFLNKDNTIVDSVTVDPLAEDTSFGRSPNGTGNFRVYNTPTPGALNQDLVIQPNPNAGLIVINEILTNNSNTYPDEDTSFEDWIEFYNTGTVAVNLNGLKLRDAGTDPTTWVFPNVTMQPHTYLVVFASNKNRLGPQLHTNFQLSSTGEQFTFLNLDNSVVSTVDVPALQPDTSWARFPNATGLFKVFNVPTPNAVNNESVIQPNPNAGLITINEVSSDNETVLLDEDNEPNDWIELYNKGSQAVNLEGLKLQDSGDVWVFPNVTINPGQYKVIFASDKNRTGSQLHTNFKLESNGETLNYLNKDNTVVESLIIPSLLADQAYGRLPNGTGSYQLLPTPTPGAANTNASSNEVTLTSPAPGSTIDNTTVTFEWTDRQGVSEPWLAIGTTENGGEILKWEQLTWPTLSKTVTKIPLLGKTVYFNLWYKVSGTWIQLLKTFPTVTLPAIQMMSPAPGTTLTTSSVTFNWTDRGDVSEAWLAFGTTEKGDQISKWEQLSWPTLSKTLNGLALRGQPIYLNLWYKIGKTWFQLLVNYPTEDQTPPPVQLTNPAPWSILTSNSVNVQWTDPGNVTEAWLAVGKGAGKAEIFAWKQVWPNLSQTVTNLPMDGSAIYFDFWFKAEGKWQEVLVISHSQNQLPDSISLNSPTPGTMITNSSVNFQWSNLSGVVEAWLAVGKSAGKADIFAWKQVWPNLSQTVTNIPLNGKNVYFEFWYKKNGSWFSIKSVFPTQGP